MGKVVGKAKRVHAKKLELVKKAVKAKKAPAFKRLDPEESAALITEHFDSAKRLAWSFLNRWRIRIEEDEVLSITGAALCEAANRFNKKLGVSFRTFFFYYLRGMLLKEIARRIQDQKTSLAIDASDSSFRSESSKPWPQIFVEHETPEAITLKGEVTSICQQATSSLDSLEQDVIRRFFVEEQSVVDIAKDLGYCRCHISRVKSRALASLAVRLEHLVDRDEGGFADSTLAQRIRAKSYRGGRGRRKALQAAMEAEFADDESSESERAVVGE